GRASSLPSCTCSPSFRHCCGHGWLRRSTWRSRSFGWFPIAESRSPCTATVPDVGEAVAIPLWLFAVLAALAAWAAYEKILLPAVHWYVANRANLVIDEVSKRLRIGIRPFQRTRRQALIDRLLTDPKVQKAAEQHAEKMGVPVLTSLKIVEGYAREIVPAFNAYLYFRIGYWIGRRVAH